MSEQPVHQQKITVNLNPRAIQVDHVPQPSTEDIEQLMQAFARIGQTLAEGVTAFVTVFSEAIEDSMRPNAYHPDGPVVRSTATVIPDERLLLEGPKEGAK